MHHGHGWFCLSEWQLPIDLTAIRTLNLSTMEFVMQARSLFAVSVVLMLCCSDLPSTAQNPGNPNSNPINNRPLTSSLANAQETSIGQRVFYDPDQVQTVHLKIEEVDQRRMIEALPECIYVPALFRWRDQTVSRVGVRFKGNSSSNPNQLHKRSYLIKFSKYEKDQRFLGMERISLDNGIQFGSLFSEPIITDILRALGQDTHRCNYAKLYVNEDYRGVYVNVERIDESFIERHFPSPTGGLWKNDVGGPGGNLQYIGDNPEAYSKAFEAKNSRAKDEIGNLITLIQRVNRVPQNDVEQMLDQNMKVDDFLKTTAVMLFSGAFDQLTGWGPHNYYLYRAPATEKWHYLPWDLDVGFSEVAFGRIHILEDWHAAWPVPLGVRNPLLERIIGNPALLARYRSHASDILENHFEPDRLCQIVDTKYALIREALATDPFPKRRATVPGDQNYDDIVESIKQFIRKRYQTAKSQLENPGLRPQPRQQNHGMPVQMSERLQKVTHKAEGIQRRLQQIQQTMQQISRLLQQGKLSEAEQLIEALEQLTASETIPQPTR